MRTSVAFASLLLLLVATTAHGIRLDRKLQEAINKKKMVNPTYGEASIYRSGNKHCSPDGHCSSETTKTPLTRAESGAAKHMQSSTGNGHRTTVDTDATTPQDTQEAPISHGSDYQEAAAATPRMPWQRQTIYPDIAGMDYSPATRRSPIHN